MRIDSELCHVDSNKIIVKITVSAENQVLGSALGQGPNVREAENSAIKELLKRINQKEYESLASIEMNTTLKDKQPTNQYSKDMLITYDFLQ